MSFLSEATATLDYDTYDYSLPHTKTIDLIGEEFVKKESCGESPNGQTFQLSATTAVPGSYTTTLPQFAHSTSLPSISQATEDNGVLYYNLDELSRSFTGNFVDNFVFDLSENLECLVKNDPDQIPSITTTSDFAKVQVVSLPTQPLPASSTHQFANSKPMTISLPTIPDPRFAPSGSNSQVSRTTPTTCSGASIPSAPFSFPTIDTTKLTGQLTVVQELPEVGRLVFQEIKTENDSIANILDGMKTEETTIPLDYTVSPTSTSPLNLVNCLNKKGVKRVVAPVQQVPPGAKRVKNVIVVQGQNGQLIQTTQGSGIQSYNQIETGKISPHNGMGHDLVQSSEVITSTTNRLMLDPPSPQNFGDMDLLMKKEVKPKTVSPKSSTFINSKFNGNASVPSSKICNWVFENGQVCGKTFSKSYNLVVHMRMHEDIRPFACNHCDQTFRQKAHLQRHETTHGIQTKNFYRASPSSKKKKKKSPCKTSKNLQDRLSRISDNLSRPAHRSPGESEDDTEADDFMEDDEDDMYVPNGNSQKNKPMPARKYSDNDLENREDTELDSHQLEVEVSKAEAELANREKIKSLIEEMQDPLSLTQNHIDNKGQFLVKQECIMDRKENLEILNLTHRPDDDENSTVQDIIENVTNVPTLEQKLESSSILNCENVLLNPERMNNNKSAVIVSVPSMFTSVSQSPNSTHYSNKLLVNSLTDSFSTSLPPLNAKNYSLAYSLASTSLPQVVSSTQFSNQLPSSNQLQQLPPTTLYTSNKTILQQPAQTTSVPAPTTFSTFTSSVASSKNQLVIENLEEHSPEIQAEILNALLADEGCMSGKGYSDADQVQEVIIGLENHKVTPSFRPRTRSRSLSSGAEEIREEEIYRDPALPQGWWVLKRRRVDSNIWDNYYYSPQGYRFRGKFEIKKFLDEGILPKGVKNPTLRFPPVPVEQLPLREENYSPRSKSSQSPAMPSTNLLLLQDTNTLAQTLIANLKPEPIEHLQNALNAEPRLIPDSLSMNVASPPLSSVS